MKQNLSPLSFPPTFQLSVNPHYLQLIEAAGRSKNNTPYSDDSDCYDYDPGDDLGLDCDLGGLDDDLSLDDVLGSDSD